MSTTQKHDNPIFGLKFMLSKEGGMAIMEENGQPSMVPSVSSTFSAIPAEFKAFSKSE